MEQQEKYVYVYYSFGNKSENEFSIFNPDKIQLIPKSEIRCSPVKISQIEGLFLAEDKLPLNRLAFPIVEKENIAREFKGQFLDFENYR